MPSKGSLFCNYYRSGGFRLNFRKTHLFFPLGMKTHAILSTKELGELIKKRRRQLRLKQPELALVSGTGIRFISDLENGKETCRLGLSLRVLSTLGLRISVTAPSASE
jgi:y4mF family transcriptional regulator